MATYSNAGNFQYVGRISGSFTVVQGGSTVAYRTMISDAILQSSFMANLVNTDVLYVRGRATTSRDVGGGGDGHTYLLNTTQDVLNANSVDLLAEAVPTLGGYEAINGTTGLFVNKAFKGFGVSYESRAFGSQIIFDDTKLSKLDFFQVRYSTDLGGPTRTFVTTYRFDVYKETATLS